MANLQVAQAKAKAKAKPEQLALIPEEEPEEVRKYKLIKRIQQEHNYPRAEVLTKLVQKEDPNITRQEVLKFLSKDLPTQVTKETKPKHTEGHIIAYKVNDFWEYDIFDLSRYVKNNDGYKYLFACVDVFSRKAYVEAMKDKDSKDCAHALQEIIRKNKVKPKGMLSDNDSSFKAGPFNDVLNKEEITANSNAHSDHRALGIIDNLAKRLKQTLTRRFGDQGSVKWTDIIQPIVSNYNKMETSALKGIAPDKATDEKNRENILTQNIEKNAFNRTETDIKEGDAVRKAIHGENKKGTDPIWTDKLFKVAKVQGNTVTLTDETTYKRNDLLIVPKDSYGGYVHPVNKQLQENRAETQIKNREKERLYQKEHGPKIRIEPVPPPPALPAAEQAKPIENKKELHPITKYIQEYEPKKRMAEIQAAAKKKKDDLEEERKKAKAAKDKAKQDEKDKKAADARKFREIYKADEKALIKKLREQNRQK